MVSQSTQSSPRNTVWETTDRYDRIITLSTERLDHIKDHIEVAELNNCEEEIKKTIEHPECITGSTKYEDSDVYSRYGVSGGFYKDKWLHVVVSFQVGGFGDVSTAHISCEAKTGPIKYFNKKL